jgi:hypothetical protein
VIEREVCAAELGPIQVAQLVVQPAEFYRIAFRLGGGPRVVFQRLGPKGEALRRLTVLPQLAQ